MTPKNNLLQVYRGLASALVVLHHISASSIHYLKCPLFADLFRVGWSGVDFFFVLSGFIITNVHFNDMGNPLKLPVYFFKRFVRVYPTYWIIASLSLLILFLSGKKEINGEILTPIYILKSYLLIPGTYPFVGVAWSLCFEVFFYSIFALMIWRGRAAFYGILCVYVIVVMSNYIYTINDNFLIGFICNGYHLEFIFGCFIAIFSKNVDFKYGRIVLVIGVVIFLVAYAVSYLNYIEKYSIMSRFLFGISSSMVILGSLKENKYQVSRYLTFLGDASFSLYLIHPLVVAFFFKLLSSSLFIKFSGNNLLIYVSSLLCFIICIIISALYFNYVENPIVYYFNKKIKDAYPTNP